MTNAITDEMPDFFADSAAPAPAERDAGNAETVMRIPIPVKVVLGSAVMPVAKLLKLARGTIIPLDRRVGEAVDIVVNGHVIARGEIVVLDEDGERFGISLTEVIGAGGRQA